jgi:DNA-binding MarR family transcriptional regulator/GNAT superfamily N-acetyltransferase
MVDVETVRRFNRTYTPRIGALQESFLGSGLPLAVARLLFEIGPGGATVRDLRRRLDLDSGYVSRLLRELEHRRLVMIADDPSDRRRRTCRLTASGRRAWRTLDARSDEVAAELLGPLTARQRERLVDALATADRLIRAASIVVREIDPRSPEATAAMTAYFAELDERFPAGFDHGGALGDGAASMARPTGTFLVADADGAVVGCGGVQRHDDATGEIKRMWIDREWRGVGLGRRLLAELEHAARALGYGHVVLDTNGTLAEAIAMYGSAGYRPIERYNDNPYAEHWFAKDLVAAG